MPHRDTLTDKELVDLLRISDEDSFTEIYNRYWNLLYNTAYAIIQDQEAAQDTVQNVFISLWNRRNEVEIRSLKAYLQQATRYLVLKAIRDRKTDMLFYERLRLVTSEIITDNPLLFKEQQQLLNTLLKTLPENERETFRLSREEGLPYKQIAARLEISEKTVEKRMSRSLKHIRNGLSWELCVTILLLVSEHSH